jgi:hypothetical protein
MHHHPPVVNFSPPTNQEGSVLGRVVSGKSCLEILVNINRVMMLDRAITETQAELAALREAAEDAEAVRQIKEAQKAAAREYKEKLVEAKLLRLTDQPITLDRHVGSRYGKVYQTTHTKKGQTHHR